MKIGVMADSHDNVPMIQEAVRLFQQEQVGLVFHAGDFVAPFSLAPLENLPCRVVGVFGNNDGERVGLARRFEKLGEVHPRLVDVEAGGRRIAVVHQDELADPIARSGHYDLVVYGHTHRIDQRRNGSLILNPGETGGWLTGRCTVAVVDLATMEIHLRDL